MTKPINLQPGETAIEYAPKVELSNGALCIPQHYLLYQHSLASVEQLILDIEYSSRYPVFVSQDDGGIYLQVGVVGYDNYKQTANREMKIVYGRKWRVEPQLPTSEIIQTAFLAIKKAREHEVRELFRLTHQGAVTTPFNNHHDLPLMAQQSALFSEQKAGKTSTDSAFEQLIKCLQSISYDGAAFELRHLEQHRTGLYLADIRLIPGAETQLPEIAGQSLLLQLDSLSVNECLFRLFEKLLALSDRHVDHYFSYRKFNRFSHELDVFAIAGFSSRLRNNSAIKENASLAANFEQANYHTDQTRIPKLTGGKLGDKIKSALESLGPIQGLPVL
ncbi:hypothetical protein [Thalassomonas actiniarum]|uniref:Uncharacterized protein n=1 Tax=Thalassomonas actiniarum TaxID=485447 RepID=A0AAE9YR47_9GAMM|nr:hypothetical protein [Thalassomonas actiniarum]WDD99147.1 hypothetical protein SG35_000210 [Thalassomonas actiniarum]